MKNSILNIGIFFLLVVGCGLNLDVQAQQNFYKFRIGPSVGAMYYYGDLTDDYPQLKNYAELGYGLNAELSLNKTFGLRFSGSKGAITYNDRTLNGSDELMVDNPNFERGLNFFTEIKNYEAAIVIYPDNDRLMKDNAFIAPYISIGLGRTHFDVFGDLTDDNGDAYNLSDETLLQDGDFETNLSELMLEEEEYDLKTWHLPLGFGFKFRLNDRWNLNAETNIKYTKTDYLDDVSKLRGDDNSMNDFYAYSSASLHYNFGVKKRTIKAPVFIIGDHAALTFEDSLAFNIDGLADAYEVPEEPTTKEKRKAAKKARKDAKKARCAAKKDKRFEAKEAKRLEKDAIKDCLADCASLGVKRDRKACKSKCKTVGYKAYLVPTDEALEGDSTIVREEILTPAQQLQQQRDERDQKLDSLKNAAEMERQEQQNGAGGLDNTNANPYATGMPSNNDTQRSVQDMQREVDALKAQQQARPASAYDPTVEMYKMEVDRLRQENSDNKILNKLEELQRDIEMMNGGGGNTDIRIEREIEVREGTSSSMGSGSLQQDVRALSRSVDELKLQVLEIKLAENKGKDKDADKQIRDEIEEIKERLKQYDAPAVEETEDTDKSEIDVQDEKEDTSSKKKKKKRKEK